MADMRRQALIRDASSGSGRAAAVSALAAGAADRAKRMVVGL